MKFHQLSGLLLSLIALVTTAAAVPSSPLYPRNSTIFANGTDTNGTDAKAMEKPDFTKVTPSAKLVWYPCLTNFSCAILMVPLDYAKPMGNRALVPLLKYPARNGTEPYKGMVLTNPGGPGEPAIDFLASSGEGLQSIIGSQYDIVTWQPRGLEGSLPLANCSSPNTNSTLSKSKFLQRRGEPANSTGEILETAYKEAKEMGEHCEEVIGGPTGAGPHMTTATVVRDMISILDAHAAEINTTDATVLNYWGFSYGSIIGQTFASMFPGRVGRVVLDGVVDATDYSKGTLLNWLQSTDEAFSTFFTYCHLAGPSNCPFYTGTSPHDIFTRFDQIRSRLDVNSATEHGWANASAIALALEGFKSYSFQQLYSPIAGFPKVAKLLAALEKIVETNVTMDALKQLETEMDPDSDDSDDSAIEKQTAISCTDNGNAWYNKTLDEVIPHINMLEKQSYIGGVALSKNVVVCTGWGITPEERYSGPFGGKTRAPMLFISNTRDPVTPLASGQRATQLFPGSQLLTIDGTGHTSFNTLNRCAFKKIHQYFQNGNLPGDNSFCPLEVGPWNITIPGGVESRSEWKDLQEQMRALV